jgi:hypothetical protein
VKKEQEEEEEFDYSKLALGELLSQNTPMWRCWQTVLQ